MATLKEAVRSGRRWRYKLYPSSDNPWQGPGPGLPGAGSSDNRGWSTEAAISDLFEIGPEEPRVFYVNTLTHAVCIAENAHTHEGSSSWMRVHDADACDKLRGMLVICALCARPLGDRSADPRNY